MFDVMSVVSGVEANPYRDVPLACECRGFLYRCKESISSEGRVLGFGRKRSDAPTKLVIFWVASQVWVKRPKKCKTSCALTEASTASPGSHSNVQ